MTRCSDCSSMQSISLSFSLLRYEKLMLLTHAKSAGLRFNIPLPLERGWPRQARAKLPWRSVVCESGRLIFLCCILKSYSDITQYTNKLTRQTVNYSCASVALLNIINNLDEVELGDELQQFKEFTMDFTPALRGDAISKFKFVRDIHNSFAR